MAPAESEFDGNDFANNLFSDLAPLLTLFGEQVTKQFLSMSIGWADNSLLAMGPLGILTIVVSAIRVGGVPKFKAIIGRAREERSTAEVELLSSTSPEVCELWTGREIVRVRGQPKMSPAIIITTDGRILTFSGLDIIKMGLFDTDTKDEYDAWCIDWILPNVAPNLALNITNSTASRNETWIWAMVGCLLQLMSLVFSGLATYYWNWVESSNPRSTYGYPCYFVGTILLCAGVAVCGHVVESVSKEATFRCLPDMRKKICIVRIQQSCTVSDQHFGSFAIFNSLDNPDIRFSRLESPGRAIRYFTIVGTSLAILGFIVQFIGLRGLHWSAAVVQLGVTLIMTVIRAIVRRGLSSKAHFIPLRAGDECASFVPVIDRIRYLLALQDQEGNDSLVKARWGEFLKERQEGYDGRAPEVWESSFMVYPQDVIMTGKHNGYAADGAPTIMMPSRIEREPDFFGIGTALRREEASADARKVLEVCTLLTINHSLPTSCLPVEDIQINTKKVLRGLKGVAEYLTHTHTVLPKSPYAFGGDILDPCLWELDGPVWEESHFMHPDSGSESRSTSPIDICPIAVRLDLKGANDYDTSRDLEAILSTWIHIRREAMQRLRNPVGQHVRIIGSATSHLDTTRILFSTLSGWLGLQVAETKALPVDLGHWQCGPAPTVCFGLYLSPIARKPPPRHGAPCEVDHDTNSNAGYGIPVATVDLGRQTLIDRCVKELFSLFILAVVENIEEIKGEAIRRADPLEGVSDQNHPRKWEHPVFEDLADIAVEAGITSSEDEARALIIPAFAWYDLLPTTEKSPAIETEETNQAPADNQSGDLATTLVPSPKSQHDEEIEA